jgi:uncharacterized protein
MRRAVLLAGGWAHPGHDQVTSMSELLAERSFETRVVRDPDDVPAAVDEGCDLLVVAACWFAMADERYTDEQRRDHAVPFSPALDQALARLRDLGCPVLALHTAVICFDGHDTWTDWIGGTWNWTTSWHPGPGPILVQPCDETPITFPAFTVLDELYQGLDVTAGVDVVAHAQEHPMVWLWETESGRAAVNVLGHDRRSLTEPSHLQLNGQLLDWLLRN